MREVIIAVAHQKGGVGKSTSTALLAAEFAELRPEWSILVEDLDPYQHLSERWPGTRHAPAGWRGSGQIGIIRLIKTRARRHACVCPGARARRSCRRAGATGTDVAQALGRFSPVLRQVQAVRGVCRTWPVSS